MKVPSFSNVVKELKTFCCYTESIINVSEEVFKHLNKRTVFNYKLLKKTLKQKTIDNFNCKNIVNEI